MHMNMDMKENEPMREFTIQHQIEHVLVVAMAQLYSLKRDARNLDRKREMLYYLNCSSIMTRKYNFQ